MDTRVCKKCKIPKSPLMFYMNKGQLLGKCKECVKADVRANYARNREHFHEYERKRNKRPHRKRHMTEATKLHRQRHPLRYAARTAVHNAITRGDLKREPCSGCGTTHRVQAHHADYSKPLEVTWACFRCHREKEHGQVVTADDDGRGRAATA